MSGLTEAVKFLREKTGVGVMDCKRALTETNGELEAAAELLRRWGLAAALKKSERVATQGLIEAYIHAGGKIGSLVEVNCESDFVARTEVFKELAHNLAMQVAAMAPAFISPEEIPPENKVDPALSCLLLQPFIKDPQKTVQEMITETIAKVGENVKVRRFARFQLGQ